ncbi:MAG: glycosyltransferase family 39 protein [Anaerolineales bacterium]|nr:glycosyltransferase family 39 protein [Anaerolineales bacterium]
MKLPGSRQKLIILGLTLLAFLLRAYRLEVQSYWIEEAWTLYFAKLPLSELWRSLLTEEPKPPFYYFATLYWLQWAGDSEYTLRFFSLIFGVMAVPLSYRLGQALGDARLGLLTALLMTVAPYQIWHSQEARMYSIFTAASIMSMWGFVKLIPNLPGFQKPGRFSYLWPWWLIYVIGTEWAILTHYHALVVIGSQGLFLLLTWRRHWRSYLAWAGTLIVIFLIYLPWLFVSSALLQRFLHWLEQPTLWETFVRGAQAYTVGEYMPPADAVPLILIFVGVYLLGLIYASRRRWGTWRGSEMLAFLLAYTLAPNLATWLYGELRTPVYFERYLIPVQVGFLLAVAMGILAICDLRLPLWAWVYDFRFSTCKPNSAKSEYSLLLPRSGAPLLLATLLLAILLAINGYALWQHYFNPAYAKDDWRAVIRKIEAFELLGDAIVLTGDGGEKLFDYYYRGKLPLYLDFLSPAPPPEEARQIIARIAGAHRRIWFTPYGVDLDPVLESWLVEHAYPAWHSWLGRKRLALYAGSATPTDRLEEINMIFADSQGRGPELITLALANKTTPAGDLLPLHLTWQTTTPLERDYQLSLRLINNRGDIFIQSDWPPLAAARATSTWPPRQPIPDRRALWLPPDLPPGSYALQLVVYDPASGQPLGQPLIIPNIPVGPAQITPPLMALPIPNFIRSSSFILHAKRSSFQLVGYVLPDRIQPGQEMWLWLYWQASSTPPAKGGGVRLTLSDGTNAIASDFPLADSAGPPDSWQAGQVRRAVYHLPTSPRLTGSQAQVKVALLTPAGEVEAESTLATVALAVRSRQFEVPAIATTADIAFGNSTPLKLIGYDLPATIPSSGDPLPVTLYWQAIAEMKTDYTVFVQLLNDTGQVVAQADSQPLAGAAPTTTWLPGEILTDPYTLTLPAHLPPGGYRLIGGLYDAAAGTRLPVTAGGDFVELSLFTVK